MNKIVLATGGFDPLHSGHIEYLKCASELGDYLIVGLNSDEWLTRKKGKPFMDIHNRASIVENLSMVDECWKFDGKFDEDGSCIKMIENAIHNYPDSEIIFVNGGDRTDKNIPEMKYFEKNEKVHFVFGVGGDNKVNSSSWLLDEWKFPKTKREWGWYRVLEDNGTYKVKELVIEAGKSLSNQKHSYRNEQWYVLKGECHITTEYNGIMRSINLHELTHGYTIQKEVWHKASNNTSSSCHILEVQFGEKCVEDDIIRRD